MTLQQITALLPSPQSGDDRIETAANLVCIAASLLVVQDGSYFEDKHSAIKYVAMHGLTRMQQAIEECKS